MANVSDRTEYEPQLNQSIDDVVESLQREIARLRESLETYRLSNHPQRQRIVRWHVRSLDERQDALEKLQVMLMAERSPDRTH